jgi:hypothetical protein
MAKHDQRILKFLNQNADRAPTITEMMTRLNISISDISDSLVSLQGQGLISKKTNNQGIECWFPNGPQASPQQVPPMQVQASHFAPQAPQAPPMQVQPMQSMRVMQAPEPQPPIPKPAPVQVSHIPMAEPVYAQRPEMPPQAPEAPMPPMQPAFGGSISNYGLSQPASKGVGILTLIVGLVLATGFSVFMAKRLASQEVKRASNTFVDKKTLLEATTAFKDFEEKTKTHVTAMEAEIKQLTSQLASSKAATDSLQTLAAKGSEPGEGDTKGKPAAGKKIAAKPKASLPTAKAKSSSGSGALAKAAARGAAKKRKAATAKSSPRETSEYSSSNESSTDSYSTPNVPEPPGLEDLPPPPSE